MIGLWGRPRSPTTIAGGNRTSVTDANNKTTTYAGVYPERSRGDDADRLTSVTDATNNVTSYAYDTENNLTSITDASLRATYFTYDAFGRVTQTNFPSNLVESCAYDAVGNLTSKTDRKNQTINYLYDALDRLTSKTYPDSSQVDYVYDLVGSDLVGKIQQVSDPTGSYSFAYDNMGRLVGTTTSYSFLPSRSFTVAYSYDAASNRTQMTDPEGGSTSYAYDSLNRLSTLTPPAAFTSGSFGFSYDALSRRTQMTRPNGVTTDYAYDNLSRLLSVLHKLAGSTIDGATYTVDAVGNRTAKANLLPAAPAESYTYDALYQLTQVVQNGATTSESYSYDPVGNRLSSLAASPWNYNVSNQLTSISGSPGTTFTYDSNGNTTSKTDAAGTTSYAWDYENRLTQVTLPGSGGTVSFTYDPLGRRVRKQSASATTIYAYDGENIAEETNAGGTAVARFAMGFSIDEPLAQLRSGATHYYSADGLGSITSLTDASGGVAATYTYDTFGNLAASAGSVVNPFRYTAREWDAETALYFYRARYYDQGAGRFLSEDPIGFAAGPNFYSYARNNPSILIDPLGLEPPSWRKRIADGFRRVGDRIDTAIYHLELEVEGVFIKTTVIRRIYPAIRQARIDGHRRFPGEQNSSMRHCTVSCELARQYPTEIIRTVGELNEYQGFLMHDLTNPIATLRGTRPMAYQRQDLVDNERGFSCSDAVSLGRFANCELCCKSGCSNRTTP